MTALPPGHVNPYAPAAAPLDPSPVAPGTDPGSPRAGRIAWIIAIVLGIAIVLVQQVGVSAKTAANQAVPGPDAPLVDPADASLMVSKILVKLANTMPPESRSGLAANLDTKGVPVESAIALVPAIGELKGAAGALDVLADLRARDTGGVFNTDLDNLQTLYERGPDALAPETRTRIEKRLGWAGRLALVFGKPDTDPVRAALLANGPAVLVLVLVMGSAVCGGFLLGCVLLVLFAVAIAGGRIKPRLNRAVPGGSIGIEIVAVFMACFFALKLISLGLGALMIGNKTGAAADQAEYHLTIALLIIQWLILPAVLLWPTIRTLRQPDARRALGLHSGEGVLKEIGCGIVGYIAGVPLLLAGAILTFIFMIIVQAIEQAMGNPVAKGPVNPLLEYFDQGPLLIILLGALAVVWAPIVEEAVFRGGLLRQLHTRVHFLIAAVLTAFAFAFMHGYPILMMGPIIGLAIGFAALRWWRGSLISCITAHALHNTIVTAMLFAFSSLLG